MFKKTLLIIFLFVIISGCETETLEMEVTETMTLQLQSSAFDHNGKIPSRYTCDGENVSPPLLISGVPESTKSFVLIMDDPDAIKPAGKVWDHWVAFNIPPDTREIEEGQNPRGSLGTNTNGNQDYNGPCPPDTEHGYIFKLYALDQKLDLFAGVTKLEVEQAMEGHIIKQTELVGRYERI